MEPLGQTSKEFPTVGEVGPKLTASAPNVARSQGAPRLSISSRNGRKRGTVAVLDQLSPAQQEELRVRLCDEGCTFEEARVWANQRFGLSLKAIRPFWKFFHEHTDPVPESTPAAEPIPLLDVTIDYHGKPLRVQVSTADKASPKGAS